VLGHAYMVLTDKIKAELSAAARRGVKVRFVTNSPESNANWLTQARFVKEWMDYMRDIPTLRIIALAKGRKLHSKTIVIDGRISVVGSYNIDPMSETINAEDAAIVKSPEFAASLLHWLDQVAVEGIEYKVRRNPDGTVTQLVGPSDHVKKATLAILKVIGWMDFLRPLI
jgi:phosphatidylserine/phosphatidylglycerophosphate/cardiolipin synthase-like enzyme